MDFSFKKRPVWRLYLAYTILFLVLAACIFGVYVLNGHTLILDRDPLNQHLPLMAKWRTAVINFLQHPSQGFHFWSWQLGLGADTFQVYSYYTMGDVFSYLALLFPAAKITLAYQVILVVRMYCVGLSFVYFAQHFNFRKYVILAGAATYLVNSFLLYACVAQPFFTTPFILFPLIVVQIERVLQGGSAWPLLGIFTWMLISNYYLAFVLGIGAMFYLVLRVLTHYRKNLNYWKTLAKLAFAAVTSILISSVMLVPELIAVMNSTRAGSEFANGLKTYPLYYYLFLPKQLINGGNWYFMFWSALGIVSIGFIALVYIYSRPKKYPLLTISLGLSLLMLLIPAIGAVFNGMMSASNRWTLLIYLPLAMAVCILIQDAPTLDHHTLWILNWATVVYLFVLIATFYFQNDTAMFMPVIFLMLSLLALWMINLHHLAYPDRWLMLLVVVNAGFNAIYAASPYNGGFAKEMLNRGEYQAITTNRYGKLDQGLDRSAPYRVNTISGNRIIAGHKFDNDLTTGMHNIDSYYSLQNHFLGQFNDSLQNIQYTANIPIRQADDRSVLNNFYGVKYIFAQSDGDNATKVPAGYQQDKLTEPIINYDKGQPSDAKSVKDLKPIQTIRYKTKQNFPLLYWQDTYISKSRYDKLSPTAKERALASGVVVNNSNQATKGLKAADLKGNIFPIKSELISNRFNKIDASHLKYTDSDETYQLQFPQLQTKRGRARYKETELHIDFSKIKYTPFSMKEQLKYEQQHVADMATNPGTVINQRFNHYKYWRYHVIKGSPDISFKLFFSSRFGTAEVSQSKQSVLSLFKRVKNGTVNIGYYRGSLPKKISFEPSKLGNYELKYQVVAENLGAKYDREVASIRRHGIQDLRFGQNTVSGSITTQRAGILTSSIPYSSGWTATVDGKSAKVLRTNQAFLGLRLSAGTHQIRFTYHLPGLHSSALISLVGLIWTAGAAIVTVVIYRKKA